MIKRGCIALILCIALVPWTSSQADAVTEWNAIALNCVQGPANPPNRAGPPGLMDIALVQAAVHDAIQAIQGRFEPYQYDNAALRGAGSPAAAAAKATYDVLVGLYQKPLMPACLNAVTDPAITYAGDPGLQAGREAAAALLPLYRPVFTLPTDPFVGGTEPGEWRPTPGVTAGANAYMAGTAPFVLNSPSQFRPEPPMPLTSERYSREYDEVKALGSLTGSTRTDEQTDLARFWSGNPIVQWFATLRSIADAHVPDIGDKARLIALVALSTADSQISVYETKYHYNFWRPITAIREGDADTNPRTAGDATWTPFIVTPPYPDHSSGANNLSGAVTTILQLYFRTDEMDFAISSGVAGLTVNPRPYARFSEAADEVVEVRILQGIHFRSADVDGRQQGSRIAHWAFQNFLKPVPGAK
jgi:hypothetical protein